MVDLDTLRRAARQEQFLDVVSRDTATARFQAHLTLAPLGAETVTLAESLGRVLAEDVVAPVDAPGFDRASLDGFALRAADTIGATAEVPRLLRINPEILTPGITPGLQVAAGTATPIATGGMLPRGADAVAMVEHTQAEETADGLVVGILRPLATGAAVAAAGSDIASGETLLRLGCLLTAREIGMLAAVGVGEVAVFRRPRVAIFSTGDELVAPGGPVRAGQVYDSNAAILAASVRELGGEPIVLGIAADDETALAAMLGRALALGDMVLLSGGTSKGAGDLAAKVVARLQAPGVVVHGVALKPGKPLCLAVSEGKPVAILPGFPTSAIMTFHEFIAPVIRAFAGRDAAAQATVAAELAMRVASERGRLEYVLVSLLRGKDGKLVAYPTAKGSGAVTAFAQADGYFAVPAPVELVASGTPVSVQRIGAAQEPADLVIIGSHCVGLDYLVGRLAQDGVRAKLLAVGSSGGLAAVQRGACDIAPIHLLDPETGVYNRPFLTPGLELIEGYGRMQGLVFRHGDPHFVSVAAMSLEEALADPECRMINRNAGSGTRILIDQLLGARRPPGYAAATKSHNGVAAAIAQGRADWGVAIATVAARYGLGFIPLTEERYDFVVAADRAGQAAIEAFAGLLRDDVTQRALAEMGFITTPQNS